MYMYMYTYMYMYIICISYIRSQFMATDCIRFFFAPSARGAPESQIHLPRAHDDTGTPAIHFFRIPPAMTLGVGAWTLRHDRSATC